MSMVMRPPAVMIAANPEERPRLFGDAGSPRGSDPHVWWHLCSVERDMLATGKGEPCSWCGRTELKLSGGEIQTRGTPIWA